ncbi:hypothetical protein JCM11641_001056 [Rhodosporidiobolus odoratus]
MVKWTVAKSNYIAEQFDALANQTLSTSKKHEIVAAKFSQNFTESCGAGAVKAQLQQRNAGISRVMNPEKWKLVKIRKNKSLRNNPLRNKELNTRHQHLWSQEEDIAALRFYDNLVQDDAAKKFGGVYPQVTRDMQRRFPDTTWTKDMLRGRVTNLVAARAGITGQPAASTSTGLADAGGADDDNNTDLASGIDLSELTDPD